MCQYLIEQVATDAVYLNNVFTCDKMWLYCYDFMFMGSVRLYCYNSMFKQQTKQMGSARFFSPSKTTHHETED